MGDRYDSQKDTTEHRAIVSILMQQIISGLVKRTREHDLSKLDNKEKDIFDLFTPRTTQDHYNSPEYREKLEQLRGALEHHYANNRHHPEHFARGINDMNLIDVLEMLADWKAASMRHPDGTFLESLKENRKRFKMSNQLYQLCINTAESLGWLENHTLEEYQNEQSMLKEILD